MLFTDTGFSIGLSATVNLLGRGFGGYESRAICHLHLNTGNHRQSSRQQPARRAAAVLDVGLFACEIASLHWILLVEILLRHVLPLCISGFSGDDRRTRWMRTDATGQPDRHPQEPSAVIQMTLT